MHGISNEELRQRPSCVNAFHRMHRFCRNLMEMALALEDSSGDEVAVETLCKGPPKIMGRAHTTE